MRCEPLVLPFAEISDWSDAEGGAVWKMPVAGGAAVFGRCRRETG
jgi:hypothetical protein